VDDEISLTYQKIRSVDEQIARASEELSRLERQAPRKRPGGTAALRGIIGLLLAACIGAAALIWQSSYGDVVRFRLAGWVPIHVGMSSPSEADSTAPAQPSLAAAEPAKAEPGKAEPGKAEPIPVQAAPAAQAASEPAAPVVAALPPEVTELLHKMAGDLATVQLGIEQLKASQDQLRSNQVQMSVDNAKFADELRARQEQMAHVVGPAADKTAAAGKTPPQASGPNAGRKTAAVAAPAPRAVATARKPAPATPAPHAAVRRSAPVQLDSAQQ
jgi:hypothetical protein